MSNERDTVKQNIMDWGIDDNFHICESCEVQAGENNHRLEQFTKYGVDELLCRDCREKIERENCKVCPECNEDITQQNQLMQYQVITKNFSNGEDFRHCKKCQMKQERNKAKNKKLKQNIWKFTKVLAVVLSIMVCAIVIGEFVETLQ